MHETTSTITKHDRKSVRCSVRLGDGVQKTVRTVRSFRCPVLGERSARAVRRRLAVARVRCFFGRTEWNARTE